VEGTLTSQRLVPQRARSSVLGRGRRGGMGLGASVVRVAVLCRCGRHDGLGLGLRRGRGCGCGLFTLRKAYEGVEAVVVVRGGRG